MPPVDEVLAARLQAERTSPFLFVGSGISRRYIGLETWTDLLSHFASKLAKPYGYYNGKAAGDLPRTASLIAQDFFEVWWASPEFEGSREALAARPPGDPASCLKYEIAKHLARKRYTPGESAQADKEVALLKRCVIDGIITTNWDSFLEDVFPGFEVYVGQETLLFSTPQSIAEIYKIHGSLVDHDSLVLTDGDYAAFHARNAYLTAKLLTVFVEHPVIFLGYSLSDENINTVLANLAQCLSPERLERLRDRLIVVEWLREDTGDTYDVTFRQIGTQNVPITVVRVHDFAKIYGPLSAAKRRFPARLLRQMKQHVYDLVKSNDPAEKMHVLDIEDASDLSGLEVVYGVGIKERIGATGYRGLRVDELLEDVISQGNDLDPEAVLVDSIPPHLRVGKKKSFVPLFKYLRQAGRIAEDGTLRTDGLDQRLRERAAEVRDESFHPPGYYGTPQKEREAQELGSVRAIAERCDLKYAIHFIPLLRRDQINLDDLQEFLVLNSSGVEDKNEFTRSYFRSLVCFLDWLRYGPPPR